ncbi:8965_t:CDS:2 [Paraglomus brasilianum]|uniref:8965_t:CDS:1 n=1 Tax=Paraglomus brasilianum TaxID=144538 RepID=A0A9N9DQM8_9GLOM|nr:8965_t:CDS:2 [Paraglomus brasilianum]
MTIDTSIPPKTSKLRLKKSLTDGSDVYFDGDSRKNQTSSPAIPAPIRSKTMPIKPADNNALTELQLPLSARSIVQAYYFPLRRERIYSRFSTNVNQSTLHRQTHFPQAQHRSSHASAAKIAKDAEWSSGGLSLSRQEKAAIAGGHRRRPRGQHIEIVEYPNVYFTAPNAIKKPAGTELTGCNFGFDDEWGDYLVVIVMGDHLYYRYEITGKHVTVKIIRNKKSFYCQALVKVKILESLALWDPDDNHNIIHISHG